MAMAGVVGGLVGGLVGAVAVTLATRGRLDTAILIILQKMHQGRPQNIHIVAFSIPGEHSEPHAVIEVSQLRSDLCLFFHRQFSETFVHEQL